MVKTEKEIIILKNKEEKEDILKDIEEIPLHLFKKTKSRGIFFVLCKDGCFSLRESKGKIVIKKIKKEYKYIVIFLPGDDAYCRALVLYEKIKKNKI